jgi:general L-amino acid transport system permease protein
VFLVGLLNTLLVSIIGIIAATIIGFLVALGRLSPNWLLSRISGGYIELIRNLPLLFQILFWYLAVLASLPSPRQSISLFGSIFLSVRGLIVPYPVPQQSFGVFLVAVVIGVLASLAMRFYARRRLFRTGQKLTIWPFVMLLVLGLPVLAALLFGPPVKLDMPELRGFNFVGGMPIRPELAALAVALSTYTAAFIAEIVRAGIQSVPKGQMEASCDHPASAACDFATADKSVFESYQELVFGGGDRLP